jgi:hypothetical protein
VELDFGDNEVAEEKVAALDDVVEKIVVKVELPVEEDALDKTETEDLEVDESVLLLEVFAIDEGLWDAVDVEVTASRLMQEHFRFSC